MKTKTLALFDFDKTLYKRDSLLEFTKYSRGNLNFYIGILLLSPYLIVMKLGFLSNQKVKERFLKYFFKDVKYTDFKLVAKNFAVNKIKANLDPIVYKKFNNHLQKNHKVYIVTASIPDWIKPWSNQLGVTVIGSELEILDNQITGNLAGKNCFGKEKVNKIKLNIDLEKFDFIEVYGSGKGDYEMLKLRKK